MTDEAAFQAVYSDFKLVKTRGTVQVIFELPIEQSSQALEALGGMPSQQKSVWCAIARMNDQQGAVKPQPVTHIPHTQPAGAPAKSYAQRIAILCCDAKFRKFLNNRITKQSIVNSENDAAEEVRRYCGVISRSEILEGTNAGNRWQLMNSAYLAWEAAPRVGAA